MKQSEYQKSNNLVSVGVNVHEYPLDDLSNAPSVIKLARDTYESIQERRNDTTVEVWDEKW